MSIELNGKKMYKAIGLIGFSGVGKSSLANMAKERGFNSLDSDLLIAQLEKKTIGEIFSLNGEDYFREMECQTVAGMINSDANFFAFGGGIHYAHKAMKEVRKKSVAVIFLKEEYSVLATRFFDKEIPLLKIAGENGYRKIYEERQELYLKSCDFIIEMKSRPLDNILLEIESLWNLVSI